MRVVRRTSLDRLFPLPDGLHFTPAMSARAMFSDAIEIAEVDMPYKERVGESKLRVIKRRAAIRAGDYGSCVPVPAGASPAAYCHRSYLWRPPC